ncbi:NAD(P)H-hydrate dehydratase [Algoriphagus winogradskyi]|uniref:Bifunctional NAD(P)H-hydrate repair enzyme n=1 Tax=Algoriphagus winogradskyi TaxID=237017 RepID=A0ABY1PD71_9BACT|nr:NAD(P)H-hydrate dehydratase [Algoriphagus winogradskyi]SMP31647.1 NAD(P)H-hydrate epimerase [Algoriphagus winogradskyi]
MQKILFGSQVKELDALHLKLSGQKSHEMMENACVSFVNWFLSQNFSRQRKIQIAVGKGNNGGDGFAIARLLTNHSYTVSILKCFDSLDSISGDARFNFNKLPGSISLSNIKDWVFSPDDILIDSFLGVGLQGELRPNAIRIVNKLNEFEGTIISIDVPSGLPSDGLLTEVAVRADITVSFEFPKLSLLLPEHAEYVGELVVLKIGLLPIAYSDFASDLFYLEELDIAPLHKDFNRFSYKGEMGKVLLVGGSPGKMGALVLCAKSALRTGSGLVTCHMEDSERFVIQTAVPEAMASWGLIPNPEFYDAVGIGPGWGIENRARLFRQFLHDYNKPIVIDADALNLLAKNSDLVALVPKNSILTPHIGEFTRLVGTAQNHLERIVKAKEFAIKNELIVVLKGANTVISMPDGRQIVNSSGNKYMATGGAGDVLTGMITSYLGMGYPPENAVLCGVYHHGLAGELASRKKRRSMIASDIIEAIPDTYLQLNIS